MPASQMSVPPDDVVAPSDFEQRSVQASTVLVASDVVDVLEEEELDQVGLDVVSIEDSLTMGKDCHHRSKVLVALTCDAKKGKGLCSGLARPYNHFEALVETHVQHK